jgi:LysM repeat protein
VSCSCPHQCYDTHVLAPLQPGTVNVIAWLGGVPVTDTMEADETIRSLPDQLGRHCPECGARVADSATNCLICGTTLGEDSSDAPTDAGGAPLEPSPAGAERGTSRQKTLRIAILVAVAIFTLGGSVILGMNLSREEVAPELPTFTPTLTRAVTSTPSPSATPTATETALPTTPPTPVPPLEYVVQAGDTLGGIALAYDLTVAELTAYNDLESEFIGEGQVLLIPPPTPTPGPTPTPEPGQPTDTPSPFIVHTVRTGDTLSTIAQEYGVSVAIIRAANDIPEGSETIRLNQVLTIPRNTPTPEPEAVAQATPTPTPGIVLYPAPTMLYPPDGNVFTGADQVIALQWVSVGILGSREFYQVELVVPSSEQRVTHNAVLQSTVWRVPLEFFPPEALEDRRFAWRVSVVRQVTDSPDSGYKIISQTTARRTFTWTVD